METHWTEEEWNILLYTIHRGNCILMLGPDASRERVGDQLKPLTEILANELAESIQSQMTSRNLDSSNLAQVSQYYSREKGKNALEAKIDAFYDTRQQLSSDLYTALAALPFYFIVTSTPDNMLYDALKKERKEPRIERYHFRGKNPKMVPKGTPAEPLIFHLYGVLEEPESLVLTEDHLLDFLVAAILKTPPLPRNITTELQDKDKCLLFLGFGFKHWYLRVLLRVLEGKSKEDSCSFALEQFASENPEEFKRALLFYRDHYRIQIYNQDLLRFIKELRRRYEEKYGLPTPTGSSGMTCEAIPTIFLCHTSKDREYAEFLSQKLKSAGFHPWFDDQNIRYGDTIDQRIERAIQTCDYFVILQSQAMTERSESNGQNRRLLTRIEELQRKWDSYGEKLATLEENEISETQADTKYRLEKIITDTKNKRQQVEEQLEKLEAQLTETSHPEADIQEQRYIKNEIQFALEHQGENGPDARHIILAKIEDCAPLEELRELQLIDLSREENIAELIEMLKID